MDNITQWIKAFVADNLSGFSMADLPNYLFLLFLTGLWAWLFHRLYWRGSAKNTEDKQFAKQLILIAISTAVAISIIRFSIPLAIGFAALLTLLRFKIIAGNVRQWVYLFLVLILGLGMGSGFAVVLSIGYVLVTAVLFFLDKKVS